VFRAQPRSVGLRADDFVFLLATIFVINPLICRLLMDHAFPGFGFEVHELRQVNESNRSEFNGE